jgi:hypothetical protein
MLNKDKLLIDYLPSLDMVVDPLMKVVSKDDFARYMSQILFE